MKRGNGKEEQESWLAAAAGLAHATALYVGRRAGRLSYCVSKWTETLIIQTNPIAFTPATERW